MDAKRPYTSHFPNKATWQQKSLVQSASSVEPDPQQKDTSNVENAAKITTTPACDVSMFPGAFTTITIV